MMCNGNCNQGRNCDCLAEQSEPVAWCLEVYDFAEIVTDKEIYTEQVKGNAIPLYLHPPKPDTEELEALCKERDEAIDSLKASVLTNRTWQTKLTRYRAVMEMAIEDLRWFSSQGYDCINTLTALREALNEE